MTKISKHKYRFLNKVILGILAVLGFSTSCDKPAEYGTPYATFKVNGTVKSNETDSMIENIQVIMNSDTQYTDINGKYGFIRQNMPATDQTFYVKFIDIDSTINAEYSNLDTTITFNNPQFTNGDGNWYEGETTKELNVKLQKK